MNADDVFAIVLVNSQRIVDLDSVRIVNAHRWKISEVRACTRVRSRDQSGGRFHFRRTKRFFDTCDYQKAISVIGQTSGAREYVVRCISHVGGANELLENLFDLVAGPVLHPGLDAIDNGDEIRQDLAAMLHETLHDVRKPIAGFFALALSSTACLFCCYLVLRPGNKVQHIAFKEHGVLRQGVEDGRTRSRRRLGEEQLGKLGSGVFATVAERFPEQRDIDLSESLLNPFLDCFHSFRKVRFPNGAVNDRDTIAAYAQMSPARVNNHKAIALLFSDVTGSQLIGVEEFDDLTFKEHEKIVFLPELDYDKPFAEPTNGFPTSSRKQVPARRVPGSG